MLPRTDPACVSAVLQEIPPSSYNEVKKHLPFHDTCTAYADDEIQFMS